MADVNRKRARENILAEVRVALGNDDLLVIERIMSKLTSARIEDTIMDAVKRAIMDANDTELYLAEEFAVTHAAIREVLGKRQKEAV